MRSATDLRLSRREGQIMDIVYARGEVTVADVLGDLPDPPSYSAVRALLRILEEKGFLAHRRDGPRYVYRPTVPHREARASALRRLVRTFFDGSTSQAVATLIDLEAENLRAEELDRLGAKIADARWKGH